MKERTINPKGYIHDGEQPLVLPVDWEVPSRQNAVAPLDVGLVQLQHGLAQGEAAVLVVDDCG